MNEVGFRGREVIGGGGDWGNWKNSCSLSSGSSWYLCEKEGIATEQQQGDSELAEEVRKGTSEEKRTEPKEGRYTVIW